VTFIVNIAESGSSHEMHSTFFSIHTKQPISYIYVPIYKNHETNTGIEREVGAILSGTVYWKTYFENLLPENVKSIHALVENTNGQVFTFLIKGEDATFLGEGDYHDSAFNKYELSTQYKMQGEDSKYTGVPVDETLVYTIRIYPTQEFKDEYTTSRPLLYSSLLIVAFVAMGCLFIVYDRIVERRQKIVLQTAMKSNAVISSLFPDNVRDRLMDEAQKQQGGISLDPSSSRQRMKRRGSTNSMRASGVGEEKGGAFYTKPIADYFEETSVLFADLSGFTAWSSVREPVS